MKRKVEFTGAALKALAKMGKVHRKFVLGGIKVHLIDNDPLEFTRHKFPLKRPSAHAERELRLDDWRIFYTILDEGTLAIVNLIGEKRGNKLIMDGQEFEL
ncbi:putative Plasmid stabilization system protein, RelE/ParE famil [Candidatus Sulfopaludibacter sp. SbA4]|nr:putative Plasmid stabilization system protein, RelE/ParE famil [Candidatus Sulfopaludibacter sp. SbA4]